MYMRICMYECTFYYCRFMHLLLLLESEFGVAPEFHVALEGAMPVRNKGLKKRVACKCPASVEACAARSCTALFVYTGKDDMFIKITDNVVYTLSSPAGWQHGKQDLLMITYVLTNDGSTRFHGVVEAVVNQGHLTQESYHSLKVLTDLGSSDSD